MYGRQWHAASPSSVHGKGQQAGQLALPNLPVATNNKQDGMQLLGGLWACSSVQHTGLQTVGTE